MKEKNYMITSIDVGKSVDKSPYFYDKNITKIERKFPQPNKGFYEKSTVKITQCEKLKLFP